MNGTVILAGGEKSDWQAALVKQAPCTRPAGGTAPVAAGIALRKGGSGFVRPPPFSFQAVSRSKFGFFPVADRGMPIRMLASGR